MSTEKLYRDSDGNERTLLAMCKHEPEWAAARIRHMLDQLDALRAAQPSAQELEALRVLREAGKDAYARAYFQTRTSLLHAPTREAMRAVLALLAPDEVSRG